MRKVLIYNRPWCFHQFEHLAGEIWPECQLISVSEHKSADRWGLSSAFYNALDKHGEETSECHLSEPEIADVILRCRLLRSIDASTARALLSAMYAAIEQCFDTNRPVAAMSVTVDSYVIHLIYLACQRHGVPFFGLIPSFVNGYFRISALGERVVSRKVEDAEVREVVDTLLRPEYKPGFLAQTPQAVRKRAFRNWMRNLPKPLWFWARRLASGDRSNYHYMTSQLISRRYWSLFPRNYSGQRPTSREDLNGVDTSLPFVFFPLQMSPEATIDYWSVDVSWIDYEQRSLELIDAYKGILVFLVKEHPNVLGFRSPGYYRQLNRRPNCILIAPDVSSNAVLDLCDGVLISTGTVGFEAALRGLPVFSDSQPFYLSDELLEPIASLKSLRLIDRRELQESTAHCGAALARTTRITRELLEGLLPGRLINDGSWAAENPAHVQANVAVAKSIKDFIMRESREPSD